jgi:hypothetical protein
MRKVNPKVKVGDRIQLFHMEGETGVPPLTKGTVTRVEQDPFDRDFDFIHVNWDNGSTLNLLLKHDVFKLVTDEQLNEQSNSGDPIYDYVKKNPEIFKNFDWRFFRNYLLKVRDSGVVNMFSAAPLLHMGKERIERYYGEGKEENEDFQEVLEMADDARYKMIQGTMKAMQENNQEIELSKVSRRLEYYAIKLLQLYITLPIGN